MHILEALVAFALAMLVFSTTVSALVEAIYHRFFHLRQAGFKRLVEQLYEDVIVGNLKIAADRQSFLTAMTEHPGVPTDGPMGRFGRWLSSVFKQPVEGWIYKAFSTAENMMLPRQVAALTTMEFIERLAATDAGQAIMAQGKERLDIIVEDIALKFERYGKSATEYFAGRAQVVTIVVSLIVAFAANIDADRLFDGLLKDPTARENLISRSDQIVARYEAQKILTDAAIAKLSGTPGAPDTAALEQQKKLLQSELDEMKKAVDAAKADLAQAKDFGLAIGTGYFPWCSIESLTDAKEVDAAKKSGAGYFEFTKNKKDDDGPVSYRTVSSDPQCKAGLIQFRESMTQCLAETDEHKVFKNTITACFDSHKPTFSRIAGRDPFTSARWFVMVLAAGLMIGLGGPFWFDVFSSLSNVLQIARAVGGVLRPKSGEPVPAADGAAPPPATGATPPQNVVEAFERVAKAQAITVGYGRISLTPSGDPE